MANRAAESFQGHEQVAAGLSAILAAAGEIPAFAGPMLVNQTRALGKIEKVTGRLVPDAMGIVSPEPLDDLPRRCGHGEKFRRTGRDRRATHVQAARAALFAFSLVGHDVVIVASCGAA